MVFKNQDLGARCAHCCWDMTAAGPFQWSELGLPCMYTHKSTHTVHICSYFYVFVCVYIENLHFTLIPSIPVHPKRCILVYLFLLALWKRSLDKPTQRIKKRRHCFADKGPYSQSYSFSTSHVWMWELDHKKGWAPKNWCFWTVLLEKTLESPLDCKEIKAVNPKGSQSWIFIGRIDAEAETPILRPSDVKSWLIRKKPDAGKNWRQEEKGTTEDEMVGWHHQLDWHEFEQALGDGKGQGSLACCSPWGRKESDETERLNNSLFAHLRLTSPSLRIWLLLVSVYLICLVSPMSLPVFSQTSVIFCHSQTSHDGLMPLLSSLQIYVPTLPGP